jgi:AraC-like DNA-binding protein
MSRESMTTIPACRLTRGDVTAAAAGQGLLAGTATRDGRTIAEGRGIAAARLQAIMADISSNLGDGDLGVAEIARRHRVTPRYIHKLFESEGLTFSAFVSYFNRTFRRRYAATPTDIRQSSVRTGPPRR